MLPRPSANAELSSCGTRLTLRRTTDGSVQRHAVTRIVVQVDARVNESSATHVTLILHYYFGWIHPFDCSTGGRATFTDLRASQSHGEVAVWSWG